MDHTHKSLCHNLLFSSRIITLPEPAFVHQSNHNAATSNPIHTSPTCTNKTLSNRPTLVNIGKISIHMIHNCVQLESTKLKPKKPVKHLSIIIFDSCNIPFNLCQDLHTFHHNSYDSQEICLIYKTLVHHLTNLYFHLLYYKKNRNLYHILYIVESNKHFLL